MLKGPPCGIAQLVEARKTLLDIPCSNELKSIELSLYGGRTVLVRIQVPQLVPYLKITMMMFEQRHINFILRTISQVHEEKGLEPLIVVDGEYYPITALVQASKVDNSAEEGTPLLFVDKDEARDYIVNRVYRVGIVGYSAQEFDKEKAQYLVNAALQPYANLGSDLMIVSGLTNLGIPALAYAWAVNNCARTKGIACKKASDFECFACDEVTIVGENWGDESPVFLSAIDLLIRIGGGKQSFSEVEKAKELQIPVIEYDL